ncbi:MAG: hypothetical protein ACJ74H_00205, partial [Thermoanaerobaculia bacterium]
MVDLVKIRNKKKRNAGTPTGTPASSPAELAASPPPPPVEETQSGGGDTSTPLSAGSGAPTKLERFKAEAGKRRAVETAKAEEAAPQNQLELLTFVMAGEQYAVDIERIVEIVTPRAVTRIP